MKSHPSKITSTICNKILRHTPPQSIHQQHLHYDPHNIVMPLVPLFKTQLSQHNTLILHNNLRRIWTPTAIDIHASTIAGHMEPVNIKVPTTGIKLQGIRIMPLLPITWVAVLKMSEGYHNHLNKCPQIMQPDDVWQLFNLNKLTSNLNSFTTIVPKTHALSPKQIVAQQSITSVLKTAHVSRTYNISMVQKSISQTWTQSEQHILVIYHFRPCH